MKTPTKFINELDEEQRTELLTLMKTAPEPVRRRTHAILLSARRYSLDQIADIYEVDRDTVCQWLVRWETHGVDGLADLPGRGRPPALNEKESAQAIKIVEQEPRSTQRNLAAVEKKQAKALVATP